jgi:imidazolonepropionase-like amidohydrolase
MHSTLSLLTALALVLVAAAPPWPAARALGAPREAAERGTFRLHKFMQPIGTETYELARDGDALALTSKFEFSDRGTAVPLAATLRTRQDLTPLSFELKGKTSRFSTVDTRIEVAGTTATVTDGEATRTEAVPERFFTTGGYAPVSVQMALLRYWLAHGSPPRLRTVPVGEVTIADRGEDVFEVNGSRVALRRYSVDGLLWGREWVWLDARQNLAAVVTIDAEFDHFEAVREGLEPALPELVARAATDGMAQLADFAETAAPVRRGTLAIVGATLVDGTGRPPVPDSVVLVRGERVVAAGPRARVEVPKGATVVDAKGAWVLPGLWDMHAHFQQVEWGPVYLAAGVTTVRDCANELEFVKAVRDALEAGRGLGPRLLLAGVVDSDSPSALGVVRANTPEEARAVVARYKQAGFQQIKLYSSVKPELVPVITAEAHRLGMTVTGHVPNGMTALQAVEAGVDQINHLHFIASLLLPLDRMRDLSPADAAAAARAVDLKSPEARRVVKTLAERRTVVDPTLALREWLGHPLSVPFSTVEPGAAKVPPALAGPLGHVGAPDDRAVLTKALLDRLIDLTGELHRAGVPIVAGTDQAIPGHSLHREIELYVKAGMSPLEAIQSATIVPARAMGLERELGTVEAGKVADLILVDADPLAAVENLRKIRYVVARGRVFEPAPLWRAVGFQP